MYYIIDYGRDCLVLLAFCMIVWLYGGLIASMPYIEMPVYLNRCSEEEMGQEEDVIHKLKYIHHSSQN